MLIYCNIDKKIKTRSQIKEDHPEVLNFPGDLSRWTKWFCDRIQVELVYLTRAPDITERQTMSGLTCERGPDGKLYQVWTVTDAPDA
jgi:hypothetical protein